VNRRRIWPHNCGSKGSTDRAPGRAAREIDDYFLNARFDADRARVANSRFDGRDTAANVGFAVNAAIGEIADHDSGALIKVRKHLFEPRRLLEECGTDRSKVGVGRETPLMTDQRATRIGVALCPVAHQHQFGINGRPSASPASVVRTLGDQIRYRRMCSHGLGNRYSAIDWGFGNQALRGYTACHQGRDHDDPVLVDPADCVNQARPAVETTGHNVCEQPAPTELVSMHGGDAWFVATTVGAQDQACFRQGGLRGLCLQSG